MVKQLYQDPKIQNINKSLNDLNRKKLGLQESMFNLEEESRKAMGSEAPESAVNAYVSDRMSDLLKKQRNLDLDIMAQEGMLKAYTEEADKIFQAYQMDQEALKAGQPDYQYIKNDDGSYSVFNKTS